MLRRRLAASLALLLLLAGPLGLMSAEHAQFHQASDEHGAPCPVCHFLGTTSLESPSPEIAFAVLVLVGTQPVLPASLPADAPTLAPARSRAPPALLS